MRALVWMMLAALPVLGACRDNEITDPVEAAVGMYSLVELNGSPLPIATGQTAGGQAEVLSGYMTLRRDSSYVTVINTQVTASSGVVRIIPSVENGLFSADGIEVRFRPANSAAYTGTREGRTISYEAMGTRATYRKP